MRTNLRLYPAVLAIVALGVLLSVPAVASAKGKGKGSHQQTLRIVADQIQSDFLDLGTPGPSLGDEFVFSERLSVHRREVGISGGVCTTTTVVPPYDVTTFNCVATLRLDRGQITLQGLIDVQGQDDSGPFTVAITGGTGAYRGAGGEAVIRNRTATRTIYKLRFDSSGKHHGK